MNCSGAALLLVAVVGPISSLGDDIPSNEKLQQQLRQLQLRIDNLESALKWEQQMKGWPKK